MLGDSSSWRFLRMCSRLSRRKVPRWVVDFCKAVWLVVTATPVLGPFAFHDQAAVYRESRAAELSCISMVLLQMASAVCLLPCPQNIID